MPNLCLSQHCVWLIEVFFHNLKRFRAIATRYEKTARNYLALVQLACAMLWLT
jgi:transposase